MVVRIKLNWGMWRVIEKREEGFWRRKEWLNRSNVVEEVDVLSSEMWLMDYLKGVSDGIIL